MSRFKAILFDCDGVLIDSEPMGCGALAEAMTTAGVEMSTESAAALFCGHSTEATLAIMREAGLDASKVLASADSILFRMFDQDIPLMEGIEQVLGDYNVPMAVCSNSRIDRLRQSIVRTSIACHFGPHIYSSEHVPAAKPAPDLAFFAAAQLGVAPEEAIFIDDNPHGLRCGRDAGCLAVGFVSASECRPHHAETLRDSGAHYVVHGMAEFHSLLAQLGVPRRTSRQSFD